MSIDEQGNSLKKLGKSKCCDAVREVSRELNGHGRINDDIVDIEILKKIFAAGPESLLDSLNWKMGDCIPIKKKKNGPLINKIKVKSDKMKEKKPDIEGTDDVDCEDLGIFDPKYMKSSLFLKKSSNKGSEGFNGETSLRENPASYYKDAFQRFKLYKQMIDNSKHRLNDKNLKDCHSTFKKISFCTPARLTSLSARKIISVTLAKLVHLLEDLGFKYYAQNEKTSNWMAEVTKCILPIKAIVKELWDIYYGCPECILEELRKEIRLSIISNTKNSVGIFILQLLFDTEIKFNESICWLLPVFRQLNTTFQNIRKLTLEFSEQINNCYVLKRLFIMCPNIIEIEGFYICDIDELLVIQIGCQNLIKIRLIPDLVDFDNEKLCQVFFGLGLKKVEEHFMKLTKPCISFPRLKVLSIMSVTGEHFPFYRMFLHFYPNVEIVDVISTHFMSIETPVSWFYGVMSDSIRINNNHSIRHADLDLYDLLSTSLIKVFKMWKNLEILSLYIGYHNNKGFSNYKKLPTQKLNICTRNLLDLFEVCPNIKDFNLRFLRPITDEVEHIISVTLEKHGHKLTKLRIWDRLHNVSHKFLVKMINYCPNLERLMIVGKPTSKFSKENKLIELNNLKVLCTGWMSPYYNSRSQVAANFLCNLLINSPNLEKLYLAADEIVLESLVNIKFGTKVKLLVMSYFKKQASSDKMLFSSLFKKLPNLIELRLDDQLRNHNDEIIELCSRSELVMSECEFNDDIVASCGNFSTIMNTVAS